MPTQRIISLILGGVLVAAAWLKLAVPDASSAERLLPARLVSVGVVWEFVLGVWLIAGSRRVTAWAAAGVTFVAFAVVSGVAVHAGQTCGCMGKAPITPVGMLAFDILAVAGLAIARPHQAEVAVEVAWLRSSRRIAWVAPAAVAVLTAATAVTLDAGRATPQPAPADDRLEMPLTATLGIAPAGEWRTATVTVHNPGATPARIVGANADCSCVDAANQLPLAIPAGESRTLTVRVQFLGVGPFKRQVWFRTDAVRPQRLPLFLSGMTEAAAAAAS